MSEPVAAPDGDRNAVFPESTSRRRPPRVSLVVRQTCVLVMIGVMNNTKWDEIRLAMYALDAPKPRFRIKDTDRTEVSDWDGEWFYHFRLQPYRSIEWADIQVQSESQRAEVRTCLHQIHVPGVETETGFRVIGWAPESESVNYL